MFLPSPALVAGMEIGETERLDIVLGHTIVGLVSENLLGEACRFGDVEHLQKTGFREAPEGGIVVQPSTLGTELFLWAHGMGNTSPAEFLRRETVILSEIEIRVAPGVRRLRKEGPFLDEILRAEAAMIGAPAEGAVGHQLHDPG
jgi:hypothetical protein